MTKITALATDNVQYLLTNVFGEGGRSTKNVTRKETVQPLKVVTLDRIKALITLLGKAGWERLSFSRYKAEHGRLQYTLSFVRDEPDASGYNVVLVSTEASIGVLHTVPTGVTFLRPYHATSKFNSTSSFLVRAHSEVFVAYKVSKGRRLYVKPEGESAPFSWTGDVHEAALYFDRAKVNRLATENGWVVELVTA